MKKFLLLTVVVLISLSYSFGQNFSNADAIAKIIARNMEYEPAPPYSETITYEAPDSTMFIGKFFNDNLFVLAIDDAMLDDYGYKHNFYSDNVKMFYINKKLVCVQITDQELNSNGDVQNYYYYYMMNNNSIYGFYQGFSDLDYIYSEIMYSDNYKPFDPTMDSNKTMEGLIQSLLIPISNDVMNYFYNRPDLSKYNLR